MSEDGKNGIEAVYEAIRRVSGVSAPPPPAGAAADGVRVRPLRTPTLPPAAHTGCYVVGPSEGTGTLIVVDPASPYPDEQAALDASLDAEADAGRPVALIAHTHHHGDHVGGAAYLAARLGVPVAAHAETARLLAGLVAVDRVVADGEELDAGGVRVRAIFTPGHAPGHLCFQVGDALIAGDMVAGIGTILIDPGEGDMTDYLASLATMASLRPASLLPAHGPVITDAAGKLREYVMHRLMREERVVTALRTATAARSDALVPLAYADTPRPLWPLAERSLISHLVKLRREGRAERDDDGTWRLL
jgi:glyoxylase-like metal-dependent hydrolase (beta-lactamase superfamily II)